MNEIEEQILDARAAQFLTRRAISEGLEDILYTIHPVLDKGFVRVVDYFGNDAAIVQAARVSYGKGTKNIRDDEGLIRYLLRHRHTTPFEMCEIKFHIKLPIFIARQWIRHRTANVNEVSGRYSELTTDMYEPDIARMTQQSATDKQCSSDVRVPYPHGCMDTIKSANKSSKLIYQNLLDAGLNRETARTVLNLNQYTEWYWKIDLHNLLHFLALRVDSHAQWEIQQYAKVMLDIVKAWVPITHEAFMDYRINATTISEAAIDVIRRKLRGEEITQEQSGITKREWNELMEVIGETINEPANKK